MKKLLSKLNEKLKLAFTAVEGRVPPLGKVTLGLVVIALTIAAYTLFQDQTNIADSTVMITSLNGNSGGSGVIIKHVGNKTLILTNKHVCGVVANGGLIKTTRGEEHTVLDYRESITHDLCLITIASKLPGRVNLANSAPKMYDHAIVSGHPALLPNVITEGHFSGNRVISVFLGFRTCTKEELKDDNLALVCIFFKGLPVIRSYETVLVTATIMPGSSGSAVYNSSKELGGLVFAGSGDIGYAFVVPYEFIVNFLYNEVSKIEKKYPDYTMDVKTLLSRQKRDSMNMKRLEQKCVNELDEVNNTEAGNIIKSYCDAIVRDYKWRKGE